MVNNMKNYNLIGIVVSLAVGLGTIYLVSYVAGKAWNKSAK